MTYISSTNIRELRNQFWKSKKHKHLEPASIIADSENKTVMFNVAGMQQLVPYLMGKDHPLGRRLYNIQKCVRTNDLDDIGDERHLSMFEMMGNRSLGDYFKSESLAWTVEFLTSPQWLGLDISRLGATIFAGDEASGIPRDTESEDILKNLGIQHITALGFDENGDSDNFWTPGPVGPCGPCSEFYYDRGVDGQIYIDPLSGEDMASDWDLGTNDRYTEIRNNVFMAYHIGEKEKKRDQEIKKTKDFYDKKTYEIIGVCIDIHKKYSNSLTEKQYQSILYDKLVQLGFGVKKEFCIDIIEGDQKYGSRFVDLVIDEDIFLELKNTSHIQEIDKGLKQIKSYLSLSNGAVGLFINFGSNVLQKNRVNSDYYNNLSDDIDPLEFSNTLTLLKNKNVDTGMGFERLCMVVQGVETIFETDIFSQTISHISSMTNTRYVDHQQSYRIICDHIRTISEMISSGVTPSNEGRGYILRRLIRRMYFNITKINNDIEVVTQLLEKLSDNKDIYEIITKETDKFQKTISAGVKEWNNIYKQMQKKGQTKMSSEDSFKLRDSYGLPRDITRELCHSHDIQISFDEFESKLEESKELARKAAKFDKKSDYAAYISDIDATIFVGYDTLENNNAKLLKDFVNNEGQRILIFDKTCFYAEGGGQIGDSGHIILDSSEEVYISNTIKYNGVYLHIVG